MWIPINDTAPPQDNTRIIVSVQYSEIKYVCIALYAERFTLLADDDSSDYDYNEEIDEYFAKPGWYEYAYNSEGIFPVSGEITHWMPIHPVPNNP